jgi:hypothetical protein
MPDANGSYGDIRQILNPAIRNLSDEELAEYLAANGIDAEGLNDFVGAVSSAMPTIQRVAGGALSGAQTGMAFGPYGALIGGIGGGLLSGFGGAQQPAPPSAPAPPTFAPVPQPPVPEPPVPQPLPTMAPQPAPAQPFAPMPPFAPVPPPAAPGAAPGLGGSPGAAQLLSLLSQPQVLQAVLSMALGSLGAPSVGIGGTTVPVSAVPRALATLANNAAAEFDRDAYDESWMALGADRNDPEAVAEAVLERFGRQDEPEPDPTPTFTAAPAPTPRRAPAAPPAYGNGTAAWSPVATYDEVYT